MGLSKLKFCDGKRKMLKAIRNEAAETKKAVGGKGEENEEVENLVGFND